MYNVLAAVLAVVTVTSVHGVPSFPAYSQQCADDAGPPWADDVQAYHKGSAAEPVLKNQTCPGPLKDACAQRGDAKTAFLEGPVKCNGKGWYCRILPDPNWPALLMTPIVLTALIWLRWKRWGFAYTDDYVYIKKVCFASIDTAFQCIK